jgi:O-antigen ligase
LLLGNCRPLYLFIAFPLRLHDFSVLPPQLLDPNGKYLEVYPSDPSALATIILWLLSWGTGRLAGVGPLPASWKSAVRPAPAGEPPALQNPAPAGEPPALRAFTPGIRTSGFALKIAAPLAGLAALAALSATQAVAPVLSLKIALHLFLLLGFVVALRNLRPPAWVVVAPLAVLLAVQGALALLQVRAQSTLIGTVLFHWDYEATANQSGAIVIELANGSRWLRAYGTFPHPNILGGFLCLALPVVAGAALRLPWRSWVAWLLWGASGLGMVALVLSFSRGAWLGVLGALVWVWLVRWHTKKPLTAPARRLKSPPRVFGHQTRAGRFPTTHLTKIAGLVLVAALVGGLVVVLGPMLQSRLLLNGVPLEQRSVDERVILLEASAVFISKHPLLGVGAGNMPLVELNYPPTSDIAQPAHNVPLAIAVETGLGGLLLWLIAPLTILWAVWRRRKEELAADCGHWALIGSAALVAVLIAAQFDHYFWSQPIGRLMFWLTLGLCCAFDLQRTTSNS